MSNMNGFVGHSVAQVAATYQLAKTLYDPNNNQKITDKFCYSQDTLFSSPDNVTSALRNSDNNSNLIYTKDGTTVNLQNRVRLDCSGFLGLVLRGIRYENSPYVDFAKTKDYAPIPKATWSSYDNLGKYYGKDGWEYKEFERYPKSKYADRVETARNNGYRLEYNDIGVAGCLTIRTAADMVEWLITNNEADVVVDTGLCDMSFNRFNPANSTVIDENHKRAVIELTGDFLSNYNNYLTVSCNTANRTKITNIRTVTVRNVSVNATVSNELSNPRSGYTVKGISDSAVRLMFDYDVSIEDEIVVAFNEAVDNDYFGYADGTTSPKLYGYGGKEYDELTYLNSETYINGSPCYESLEPGDILCWSKRGATDKQKSHYRGISHVAVVAEKRDYYYQCTTATSALSYYIADNGGGVKEGGIYYTKLDEAHAAQLTMVIRPHYKARAKAPMPLNTNLLAYPPRWGSSESSTLNSINFTCVDMTKTALSGTSSAAVSRSTRGTSSTKDCLIWLEKGRYKLSGMSDTGITTNSVRFQIRTSEDAYITDENNANVAAYDGHDSYFNINTAGYYSAGYYIGSGKTLNCVVEPRLECLRLTETPPEKHKCYKYSDWLDGKVGVGTAEAVDIDFHLANKCNTRFSSIIACPHNLHSEENTTFNGENIIGANLTTETDLRCESLPYSEYVITIDDEHDSFNPVINRQEAYAIKRGDLYDIWGVVKDMDYLDSETEENEMLITQITTANFDKVEQDNGTARFHFSGTLKWLDEQYLNDDELRYSSVASKTAINEYITAVFNRDELTVDINTIPQSVFDKKIRTPFYEQSKAEILRIIAESFAGWLYEDEKGLVCFGKIVDTHFKDGVDEDGNVEPFEIGLDYTYSNPIFEKSKDVADSVMLGYHPYNAVKSDEVYKNATIEVSYRLKHEERYVPLFSFKGTDTSQYIDEQGNPIPIDALDDYVNNLDIESYKYNIRFDKKIDTSTFTFLPLQTELGDTGFVIFNASYPIYQLCSVRGDWTVFPPIIDIEAVKDSFAFFRCNATAYSQLEQYGLNSSVELTESGLSFIFDTDQSTHDKQYSYYATSFEDVYADGFTRKTDVMNNYDLMIWAQFFFAMFINDITADEIDETAVNTYYRPFKTENNTLEIDNILVDNKDEASRLIRELYVQRNKFVNKVSCDWRGDMSLGMSENVLVNLPMAEATAQRRLIIQFKAQRIIITLQLMAARQ